jgi:hypothetical protein
MILITDATAHRPNSTRPSTCPTQARNSELPTCRHMFEEKREAVMAIEAAVLPLN